MAGLDTRRVVATRAPLDFIAELKERYGPTGAYAVFAMRTASGKVPRLPVLTVREAMLRFLR